MLLRRFIVLAALSASVPALAVTAGTGTASASQTSAASALPGAARAAAGTITTAPAGMRDAASGQAGRAGGPRVRPHGRRLPHQPAGFTFCANENSTCTLPPGSYTVAYGADGMFLYRSGMSGSFSCSNTFFGTDPAPGIVKACYYQQQGNAGPPGFRFCASENSTCTLPPGTFRVAYGAQGMFLYRSGMSGSFSCSNTFFGTDPAPGIVKACYYQQQGNAGPPGYTFCANENTTCSLPPGTYTVAYGASGMFLYRGGMRGSFSCSNTFFGIDPAPGIVKACYYRPVNTGPRGFRFCANENGNCYLAGFSVVAYGAQGRFVYRGEQIGVIPCTNSYFGTDPAPGVVKACYYLPEEQPGRQHQPRHQHQPEHQHRR